MPRYFIDSDDNDVLHIDEDGLDLPDDEAARCHAQDALPDMAREHLPDGNRRTFVVAVRNAEGEVIYRATLALRGEWVQREIN